MDKPELNFCFHNPNTAAETADLLVRLLAEAQWPKLERLLLEAAGAGAPPPAAVTPGGLPAAAEQPPL